RVAVMEWLIRQAPAVGESNWETFGHGFWYGLQIGHDLALELGKILDEDGK
ncbi:hypothetical protein LCGC14_3120230, partial [marine sediment metagenome]